MPYKTNDLEKKPKENRAGETVIALRSARHRALEYLGNSRGKHNAYIFEAHGLDSVISGLGVDIP